MENNTRTKSANKSGEVHKFKEKIRSLFYHPSIVKREVTVNGRHIEAEYNPDNGELKFYNKEGEHYELNGAGAFSTLNAVFDAFNDIDMKKISYDLNKSDKHIEVKDRFYARALKARGYVEKRFTQRKSIFQHHRMRVKKRESKSSSLENYLGTMSIIALILGIFLVFPVITGNVIGQGNSAANLIGIIFFTLGIITAFIYIKNRQSL